MPTTIQLEAERMLSYGPPDKCHKAIAKMWTAYLSHRRSKDTLWDHDVAIMMVLLKMVRAAYSPSHLDNYDDAMAYLTFARRFISGDEGCGSSAGGSSKSHAKESPTRGKQQSFRFDFE